MLKNQSTPVEVFVNKSQPNELTATYQVNFNFARAVTLDGDAAKTWGRRCFALERAPCYAVSWFIEMV